MKLPAPLHNLIRVVLKYTLNPLTRRLARSPFGPFALVRHIGRKSGKSYETPIIVAPFGSDFVIELTYGPEVDWYKNVMAAGKCVIIRRGHEYAIDKIEPMDTKTGRAAFPLPAQLILRAGGQHHFLKLSTQN